MRKQTRLLLIALRIGLLTLAGVVFASYPAIADEVEDYRATKECYRQLTTAAAPSRSVWLDCAKNFADFAKRYPNGEKVEYAILSQAVLFQSLCTMYQRPDDCEHGVDKFTALTTRYPNNKYADVALFSASTILREHMGDKDTASLLLNRLLREYPNSPKALEAARLLDQRERVVQNEFRSAPASVPPSPSKTLRARDAATASGVGTSNDDDLQHVRCWQRSGAVRVAFYGPNVGAPMVRKHAEGETHIFPFKHAKAEEEKLKLCFRHVTGVSYTWHAVPSLEINIKGNKQASGSLVEGPRRFVLDIPMGEGVAPKGQPVLAAVPAVSPGVDAKKTSLVSVAGPGATIEDIIKGRAEPTLVKPRADSTIRRIVIDPGHGGEDSGAVGYSGLKEKDVALRLGRFLKDLIEQRLRVKAYLTRDKDVYLNLEERASIANQREGDLFISLHCNAAKSRDIAGIETYFLNMASDEGSLRLAARENIVKLGDARKNIIAQDNLLDFTLLDLVKNQDSAESSKLARFIQTGMMASSSKFFSDVRDLGVKSANFNVLWGVKMPSILVEVSFISNPSEEQRLRNDFYLQSVATGITQGIKHFVMSRGQQVL